MKTAISIKEGEELIWGFGKNVFSSMQKKGFALSNHTYSLSSSTLIVKLYVVGIGTEIGVWARNRVKG